MKFILLVLSIFVLSIWAGVKIAADPGYALFAYENWTVQMPLWVAAILTVLLFILCHQLLLLIRGTTALRQRLRLWRRAHRREKAARMTNKGLKDLAEGRWLPAEKALINGVANNDSPLINYLAAAEAAQERGEENRRDDYLRMAYQSTPDSELAIGLTQAKLQYSQHQWERALATLKHLQQLDPKHPYVLKLLKNLYEALGDWHSLIDLLPVLKKHDVIATPLLFATFEKKIYFEYLKTLEQASDWEGVTLLWHNLPRHLKRDQDLWEAYTRCLIAEHKFDEAAREIKELLKQTWNAPLVRMYGLLETKTPEKNLHTAQTWEKQYGHNKVILLTLGRLSLKNHLWGQAKSYFESALLLEPSLELYAELGRTLEQIGDHEAALSQYRQGMLFAQGEAELGIR